MHLFCYRTRSTLPLLVLLMLTGALPAKGQITRVSVESASVAEATTSVPLQTEVRFTLNQPVTLDDLDGDPFVAFPEGAITYAEGTPTLSADGRRLTYTVTHQADTDYTWLLVGGTYTFGDGEAQGIYLEPYVLRYTTAADLGTLDVSGEVSISEAIEGEVVEGTVVFLTEASILDEEEAETVAAAVADASGNYTIPYLRADVGVVYPFAIKVPELTSADLLEDQFDYIGYIGFYDEEGDDLPTPITVGTESIEGIDIEVKPFGTFVMTAEEAQIRADALAASFAADQQLVAILGSSLDASDGELFVPGWSFVYYSASLGQRTVVSVGPFESEVETEAFTPTGDVQPLPMPYLAPTDAFATAEAQGGSDFRAQYGGEEALQVTFLMAGLEALLETDDLLFLPENLAPPSTSDPYWTILYLDFSGDAAAYLAVFIDMQTGTVIGTDAEGFVVASEDEAVLPEDVRLGANYPNPFNPTTTIPFALRQPGPVRLTVYNALGQEVARLVDGNLAAGEHEATWQAGTLPSGTYFYTLEASGHVQTRALTLLK